MMDNPTRSPQRQRILSSINPETEQNRDPSPKRHSRRRHRSRSRERDHEEKEQRLRPRDNAEDTTKPRRSRLRLKDESSKHRRRRHGSGSRTRSSRHYLPRSRSGSPSSRSRRRDTSRSPRRHRRRTRHRDRSPTPPNPHLSPPLDPEAAFRASLFDAMADDEGAAYWEGVYGQPIHIYEEEYTGNNNDVEGSLERMSEEEYAAYVRQKMWEKTHAGILEERARREQLKKEKDEKRRREKEFHEETMRNAQREDEQRFKRRWQKRYQEYLTRWADIPTQTPSSSSSTSSSRPRPSPETILPWPVDSGRREDISETAIRTFFLRSLNAADVGEAKLAAALKEERVRWHPDKIQQRLGGDVEDVVVRDVTAIFQTVDKMWAEVKGKA